jgi:hypothetical protein
MSTSWHIFGLVYNCSSVGIFKLIMIVRYIFNHVKVVDIKPIASHRCRFERASVFRFFMWENYLASSRNVGGSTLVPVFAWNNEVFLHQKSLKDAIWPIMCLCDVKPKQTKTNNNIIAPIFHHYPDKKDIDGFDVFRVIFIIQSLLLQRKGLH